MLLHETYGRNPRIFPESRFREVAPAYVEERDRMRREAEEARQHAAGGGQPAPRQLPNSPVITHEMNWVNAIKAKHAASCPFDYAAPLTETMLLGIVALKAGQGRPIHYDGERMAVTNVPEANAYLQREYRPGWTL